MTRLEQIRNDLDNYIKKELEKSPPDRSFEVFSFEEKLCEIVDSLDEIIYFDPTPDGDSPYSDAEYIITPEERDRNALLSKQESHGRGNPFNWWLIMTNNPLERIEQKEFNLKFSFEMLTSTIMFIQKVQSLYPDENNPVNKNCTNLLDEIVDQLIEEDCDSLNSYFNRINLDNQLDHS